MARPRKTMTERPSDAARHFLATSGEILRDIGDIHDYRALNRDIYLPRAERAVEEHDVMTEWCEVANVRCLLVNPRRQAPECTLMHCFGGGFISGSPEEELIVAAPLANLVRAQVVIPAYRLAPEHPFPAGLTDAFSVYARLTESNDRNRLVLTGESAGGNLALAVLNRAQREGVPLPAAVAMMSPWCDLGNGGDSVQANDGRDPTLSNPLLEQAADLYAGSNDRRDPEISPLFARWDARIPPMLITSGTRDLLLSQAVQLSTVLRSAGVPVDLRLWDGLWHVFEFYDELPEAAESLWMISAFLKARMV